MSRPIPNTTISSPTAYTTLADGQTPYNAGFLFIFNDTVFISTKVGPGQGTNDWSSDIPAAPGLWPLAGGTAHPNRPNPDFIYGVRARQLNAAPATAPQIFGALFQPGEATILPSSQITGTLSSSGGITPTPSGPVVIGYAEWTGSVSITATTQATANTVVTAPAVVIPDTSPIVVEFYCPRAESAGGGVRLVVVLYEDGVAINDMGQMLPPSGFGDWPIYLCSSQLARAVGSSHTYSIRAYGGAAGGVMISGPANSFLPGYVKVKTDP